MLTLPALRHSFHAAFAVPLLLLLFGFMPFGTFCSFVPPLPRFAAEVPWVGHETDVLVTVRHDGSLLIGQNYVHRDCVTEDLHAVLERAPGRRVILQIDRRSDFRGTREVLGVLRHLGIRHVLLNTGWRSVADTWKPPAGGHGPAS